MLFPFPRMRGKVPEAEGGSSTWKQRFRRSAPTPALLSSVIQTSPSNPALRILLRALSGARASGSQARRFTLEGEG